MTTENIDEGTSGGSALTDGLGLTRMEQLLAFCDWERVHNPHPNGKPHIAEWAAAEIERLSAELAEQDALRERMADILSRTAVALRGPEPSLTRWSWHDLPERAAEIKGNGIDDAALKSENSSAKQKYDELMRDCEEPCGKRNDGVRCRMRKGSTCPDCGLGLHDFGAQD